MKMAYSDADRDAEHPAGRLINGEYGSVVKIKVLRISIEVDVCGIGASALPSSDKKKSGKPAKDKRRKDQIMTPAVFSLPRTSKCLKGLVPKHEFKVSLA